MDRASTAIRPFSMGWVLASMGIFVGVELLLGVLVGTVMVGAYTSHATAFLVQGVLHLTSFFVGGFVVGVVSPGLRIREPAIGAFLTMALMFSLTMFTPYAFLAFTTAKLVIGGAVAFGLALVGATLGERLMGHRI